MSEHIGVAAERWKAANDRPVRPDGRYVLYWMCATRRVRWNYGLQRAVEHAQKLRLPLVVYEGLGCSYRWASDRFHAFVLQGMADNRAALLKRPVRYYGYVEPSADAGKGLVEALAAEAALVVTDEFPCFEIPRYVAAVASRSEVAVEVVDSNGLLPLRATDRVFTRAHSFRRFLHKELLPYLEQPPLEDPTAVADLPPLDRLPDGIEERWPETPHPTDVELATLPIDHSVAAVAQTPGGSVAGRAVLRRFLDARLARYGEDRNHPDRTGSSELSPYLHFGHVAAHEVFAALASLEDWDPSSVAPKPTGSREGWWGMGGPAEAFLDEFVTWREIGLNQCHLDPNYDRYESLPDWARKTIEDHAGDQRPELYQADELAAADTHDEIWNAAQRELVRTGRMHNYLRMLWGKKIFEWSTGPEEALEVMIDLNNRYAIDGRDPNSYSGIFWCLGRYDRAWGPERPIFGKIRYMSSDNTRRKLKLRGYLEEFGE